MAINSPALTNVGGASATTAYTQSGDSWEPAAACEGAAVAKGAATESRQRFSSGSMSSRRAPAFTPEHGRANVRLGADRVSIEID